MKSAKKVRTENFAYERGLGCLVDFYLHYCSNACSSFFDNKGVISGKQFVNSCFKIAEPCFKMMFG